MKRKYKKIRAPRERGGRRRKICVSCFALFTFHAATASSTTATATGALRSAPHGRPASEPMTQIGGRCGGRFDTHKQITYVSSASAAADEEPCGTVAQTGVGYPFVTDFAELVSSSVVAHVCQGNKRRGEKHNVRNPGSGLEGGVFRGVIERARTFRTHGGVLSGAFFLLSPGGLPLSPKWSWRRHHRAGGDHVVCIRAPYSRRSRAPCWRPRPAPMPSRP